MMPYRSLTEHERDTIIAVLAIRPELQREFAARWEHYTCTSVDGNGSLSLHAEGFEPEYPTETGPAVTAMQDDGQRLSEADARIEIIAFYQKGYLTRLEVFRQDGTPIRTALDARLIESVYGAG